MTYERAPGPQRIVTVGCYGPTGSSSRVRMFDWLDHLGIEGDNYTYLGTRSARPQEIGPHPVSIARAERGLRRLIAAGSRRLLLSREATPFSRGGVEARLLRSSERGVLDIDDGLMWNHRRFPDPAFFFDKQVKADRAIRAAHTVIAGNHDLHEWISNMRDNVVYIPSCIEPGTYSRATNDDNGTTPTLVWLGSPSTEWFLEHVTDALLEVNRLTGARLVVISAGSRPLGRLEPMVHRAEWGLGSFAGDLARGHVAIAPMTDTPFNRGKCSYKILQYAATSLPTVVSPVGANTQVAELLGCRTAGSTEQWVDELRQAIESSSAERRAEGDRLRSNVAVHFSFDSWAPAWRAALDLR